MGRRDRKAIDLSRFEITLNAGKETDPPKKGKPGQHLALQGVHFDYMGGDVRDQERGKESLTTQIEEGGGVQGGEIKVYWSRHRARSDRTCNGKGGSHSMARRAVGKTGSGL